MVVASAGNLPSVKLLSSLPLTLRLLPSNQQDGSRPFSYPYISSLEQGVTPLMVVASAGNLPSVKLLSSLPLILRASSFKPTGWQPALILSLYIFP